MRRALALLGLALTAARAPAADVWQPAGKWNLDLGASNCVLGRMFAAGQQTLLLGFETKPPGGKLNLITVTPAGLFRDRGEVSITVPGAPAVRAAARVQTERAGVERVTIGLDRELIPALVAAGTISLESGGRSVAIKADGTKAGVAAIQQCEDGLYAAWKLDRAEIDRAAIAPKPSKGWISADDYPAEEMRAGHQGDATALIKIDEQGKAIECRIAISSGYEKLDSTTCRIFTTRVEYLAGRDKEGHAVPGWLQQGSHWILPGR